jgi:hypothetical protein
MSVTRDYYCHALLDGGVISIDIIAGLLVIVVTCYFVTCFFVRLFLDQTQCLCHLSEFCYVVLGTHHKHDILVHIVQGTRPGSVDKFLLCFNN